MTFDLVQLRWWKHNVYSFETRVSVRTRALSIDKKSTGKIGPSRRTTKTLDSITSTASLHRDLSA